MFVCKCSGNKKCFALDNHNMNNLVPSHRHWPSKDTWDKVATELRDIGVATVDLPPSIEEDNEHAFGIARSALTVIKESPSSILWIPVDADSVHATGYHTAGGENSLSRYNEYREGFVISDDHSLEMETVPEFCSSIEKLSGNLHKVADHALEAIERQLDIAPGWFQKNLGPTKSTSQFHIKRYVVPEDDSGSSDNGPRVVLPMHTDPSLLSIIVHDAKGRNENAMGLEYISSAKNTWRPVPFHGHSVAVVFVGSVLSYMTGNTFPSIKHRVVHDIANRERIAATLFVRPQLTATLQVPPSKQLSENMNQKKSVMFSTWITRVSRNYGKKKTRQGTS